MCKYQSALHTVYLTHLGFHLQWTWKGKTLLLKPQFQNTVATGQRHLKKLGSITCVDITALRATVWRGLIKCFGLRKGSDKMEFGAQTSEDLCWQSRRDLALQQWEEKGGARGGEWAGAGGGRGAGAGWGGNCRNWHCHWICPLADHSQSPKEESVMENSSVTSLKSFYSAALVILHICRKSNELSNTCLGFCMWSVFPGSVCANDSCSWALPPYSLFFSDAEIVALLVKVWCRSMCMLASGNKAGNFFLPVSCLIV